MLHLTKDTITAAKKTISYLNKKDHLNRRSVLVLQYKWIGAETQSAPILNSLPQLLAGTIQFDGIIFHRVPVLKDEIITG